MVRKLIVDRVEDNLVVLVTDLGESFQMPRSLVPFVKEAETIVIYHERISGEHMKPKNVPFHTGMEHCSPSYLATASRIE